MLAELPVDLLLDRIAQTLEHDVLPAVTGAAERRQCRAAIYLLRGIAGASPTLLDVLAADVAQFTELLGQRAGAAETSHDIATVRNELAAALSSRLAHPVNGTPDPSSRSTVRESLDRWIALWAPATSLGQFVTLADAPIVVEPAPGAALH